MLAHLFITNYALIDHLEIDFKRGLTTITGETGAGKSILLGALSLILGERADLKVVRNPESKSIIEATFDISDYSDLKSFFEKNDIDFEEKECILRREISSNGRSRAFVNDSPVNLNILQELTIRLIDIHSQHNNMLLSKTDYQLRVLDSVSADKELLEAYSSVYSTYRKKLKMLDALRKDNEQKKNDEDYTNFQLSQIATLKLQEGEDLVLEETQRRLENVSDIKVALWDAVCHLQDNDDSIVNQLSQTSKNLSKISDYDKKLDEIYQRIESSLIELKDIAMVVDTLQNDFVDDPNELERISSRLDSIYELETKHKLRTVDELLALQKELEVKLNDITHQDEEIAQLELEVKQLQDEAMRIAVKLSEARKEGARRFSEDLYKVASPLGMHNLSFEVSFEKTPLSRDGIDQIQFLFAFNKQQKMMPVENTASGGEISRLMLCIKSIIAQNMQLPTIIFDEVDTGVSGDIANRMGEMMCRISKNIQVITITHLPQVAVKGDNHIKVYKKDSKDATFTAIKELSQEERVNEIAAMLSGEKIDTAAIENAKSLMGIK